MGRGGAMFSIVPPRPAAIFRRVATGDAPLWGRLTTFHPGWQPDGQGLSIVRGKNAL
jgi:hypothetical protein